MLPCQHTFCYSCLLSLEKLEKKITCPQCRKDHIIPADGVAAFQENLLLNNLLPAVSMQGNVDDMCEDCRIKPSVQICSHCDNDVCATCFIQHKELLRDAKRKLNDLRMDFAVVHRASNTPERKMQLAEFAKKIQKEVLNAREIVAMKLESMKSRQNTVEVFMNTSAKVLNDLCADDNGDNHLPELTDMLTRCKMGNELTELINKLHDLQTVMKAAETEKEYFRIDFDGELPVVKLGKSEVRISSTLQGQNHTSSVSLSKREGPTESTSINNEHHPFGKQREDSGVTPMKTPNSPCIEQNMLPKNVHYEAMKQRWKTIVGQGKLARSCLSKLDLPIGCAHHLDRNEIYIADCVKNAVMVYNDDGSNGRILYQFNHAPENNDPSDIAISNDGRFLYVTCEKVLVKLSIDGQLIKQVTSFSGGVFECCRCVVVYREMVLALDRETSLIAIFNHNLEECKGWFANCVKQPRAMAVSNLGEIYVTDGTRSCVRVISLEGEHLCTFGSLDHDGDAIGVAVDGDGYVCVARYANDRVDVYGPRYHLVTSIGSSGRFPGGFDHPTRLSFTPQGRLIVSDRDNHRVQIF